MAEIGPNATLDDIVFADRNKAYGAFSLRRGYRADVTKATLIGAALFVLAMFTPSIINKLSAGEEEEVGGEVGEGDGRRGTGKGGWRGGW